jgi:hypothetical protein
VVRSFHGVWSWVVIVGNGGTGAWALAAARWSRMRTRTLWWSVGFAQVAVFLQVFLGVYLMAHDHVQAPKLHTFYGFLTIISVAIIHSYRHQLMDRICLLYGLGGLFIMGLGIRAVVLK